MATGGLWWLVASTDIWSWLASVGGALRRIHRPDDQLKGMTVDANTTCSDGCGQGRRRLARVHMYKSALTR